MRKGACPANSVGVADFQSDQNKSAMPAIVSRHGAAIEGTYRLMNLDNASRSKEGNTASDFAIVKTYIEEQV